MKKEKRERLEKMGWKIGTVGDFLELTPEEESYIDLRLALSRSVKKKRKEGCLTQEEVAKRIGSSQSRMAKLEAGDSSVSLDLLVNTLLALGTSMQELSQIIGSIPSRQNVLEAI